MTKRTNRTQSAGNRQGLSIFRNRHHRSFPMDITVIFARRVFLIAGVYGLLVLVQMYFTEAKLGRDFPPPITHPEHYYGFIGVAIAWQVVFLVIARDPIRYRLVMLPAILEKLAFGLAAVVLFFQGRLATLV